MVLIYVEMDPPRLVERRGPKMDASHALAAKVMHQKRDRIQPDAILDDHDAVESHTLQLGCRPEQPDLCNVVVLRLGQLRFCILQRRWRRKVLPARNRTDPRWKLVDAESKGRPLLA